MHHRHVASCILEKFFFLVKQFISWQKEQCKNINGALRLFIIFGVNSQNEISIIAIRNLVKRLDEAVMISSRSN
jgi:hypothetical protein